MMSGALVSLAVLRVPRGQARPSEEQFREALAKDRERLHHSAPPERTDVTVAGPYPIEVDGAQFDEYVAWEH